MDENHGQFKAKNGADQDFADPVAGAFFETGIFFSVDVQLFDEHVEITALIAKVHPETSGIVDDQKSQGDGDGERAGVDSFEITHGSDNGDRKSRVGAGHMAVGENIADVPAVFEAVDDKFQDLNQDSHHDWDDENRMRSDEFEHNFILIN